MKPTSGSSTSGSTMHKQQTTTLSADQAYQLVGLLIVEGRMPHSSLKGRIEGPHATKTDAHTLDDHMCSHENALCKNAEHYSQQLSRTGQTMMPVSVEVLLLPECESGQQAANAATTETDAQECCSILLERWHIEVSHNRSRESSLSLKMLMQAVRSYLGFSQLSAWYVRSGGQQPKHVVYRIAVLDGADSRYRNPNASESANDSSGCTSIMDYEQLAFPNVLLANELLLTVSLCALKRQPERPILHCRLATCGECHKRMPAGSGTPAQPTLVLPSSPPSPPRTVDELSKSMPARSDPSGPNDTIVPASSTQNSSLSLSVSTVSSLSPTIEDSNVSGENVERFEKQLVVSTSKSDMPSLLAVSSAARRCLVFTDDNQNVRTPTSPSDALPGDTKRCVVDAGSQTRKSKMRNERKILFSDSSSNESLDRLEFRAGRDRRWSPAVSSSTSTTTLLATTSALARPTDSRSSPTRAEESSSAAPQKEIVPTATVPVKVNCECETTSATVKLRSQSVSESIDTVAVVNERTPRRRSSKSISASKPSVRPPSDSSPAPLVRTSTGRFDYVSQPLRRCGLSLPSPLAAGLSDLARSAPSSSMTRSNRLGGLTPTESAFGSSLVDEREQEQSVPPSGCSESGGAAPPAAASGYVVAQNLVVNFEESLLNGRISPSGSIDGFSVTLSAAGAQFSTPHVSLPVAAEFFRLSDDNSPSPYLGRVELCAFGKHGFRVPSHGVLQVTLFNPNSTVMKMFVVVYDLSAMPPSSQTFLRQRTYYMPVKTPAADSAPRRRSVSGAPNAQQPDVDAGQLELPSYLRYVIHLRLQTSKRGHLHLHKDIRMIIARDSFEFDPQVARYELRSILEQPTNPTFSPIR